MITIPDPQEITFVATQHVDLVGTSAVNAPERVGNQLVVFNRLVPKGQVEIIYMVAPFGMRRVNVGGVNESVEMMPPALANLQVLYTPTIETKAFILDVNTSRYHTAATASNIERFQASGIPFILEDPWAEALRTYTRLNWVVPGDSRLRVLFRLAPLADNATAIPSPLVIGTPPPGAAANRIDFAGAVVAGIRLPAAVYASRVQQRGQS